MADNDFKRLSTDWKDVCGLQKVHFGRSIPFPLLPPPPRKLYSLTRVTNHNSLSVFNQWEHLFVFQQHSLHLTMTILTWRSCCTDYRDLRIDRQTNCLVAAAFSSLTLHPSVRVPS